MEQAAKNNSSPEPTNAPSANNEGAQDTQSARQFTRCLILLPHPDFNPAHILRSFRRRQVEIEIYVDNLTLLADLANTTRQHHHDLSPTSFPPPTIIFIVEPVLNDETFAFLAAIEKYFPHITLLAHTEDPAAHQIASLLANTNSEQPLQQIATAATTSSATSAQASESPTATDQDYVVDVEPANSTQQPSNDLEQDSEPENDHSFLAPPAFDDETAAHFEDETTKNGNHPHQSSVEQPEPTTQPDEFEEDERLVSEEELDMLLGDGDFLFVDEDDHDNQNIQPDNPLAHPNSDSRDAPQ